MIRFYDRGKCLTKLQKKEPFINIAIHSIVAISFVIRIRTYSYYYVLYLLLYTRRLGLFLKRTVRKHLDLILLST